MKTSVRAVCHEMQSHEQERIHMKMFIREEPGGRSRQNGGVIAKSHMRVRCLGSPDLVYTHVDELSSRPFLLLHHFEPIRRLLLSPSLLQPALRIFSHSLPSTFRPRRLQQQHNVHRRL